MPTVTRGSVRAALEVSDRGCCVFHPHTPLDSKTTVTRRSAPDDTNVVLAEIQVEVWCSTCALFGVDGNHETRETQCDTPLYFAQNNTLRQSYEWDQTTLFNKAALARNARLLDQEAHA